VCCSAPLTRGAEANVSSTMVAHHENRPALRSLAGDGSCPISVKPSGLTGCSSSTP
jgi:hypothetical protein